MNAFNSFLEKQLADYLAYRQSLGFATKTLRSHLRTFDRYLARREKEPVLLLPSFFLELRADLNVEARTVDQVLSTVRAFFGYLVRCGDYATNPVKDIPLLPKNEIIPFIFTDKQVDQLLLTVCKEIRKDSRYFIKDLSMYLAFVLLARCGMRISEPLRLLKHHNRHSERTLYIEKTKFKKDRLIPIPKTVDTHVHNYLNVRDKIWGDYHNPYLLAGSRYSGLRDYTILHLLYDSGARASEMATLRLDYFDPQHQTLAILGKADRYRQMQLWPKTAQLIETYIAKHRTKPNRLHRQRLFINQRGDSFTRHGINRICKKYLQRTLDPKRLKDIYPVHSFRHACAVRMLCAGDSITDIKNRLGHENLQSTMTYLDMDLTHKRRIQEQFILYNQTLLNQDPELDELIGWEDKQDTLAWLDTL